MTKEDILKVFPGLNSDNHFKITSPYDENYNCIAWAAIHTDYWLWPPGGRRLDGVLFYWPTGVPKDDRLSSFIKMYETYPVHFNKNRLHYRLLSPYLHRPTKTTQLTLLIKY